MAQQRNIIVSASNVRYMSRMYRIFCILSLLICVLFAVSTEAQTYPAFEGSTVMDEANLLSPEVEQRIHNKIMAHEDRTGQEMAVVTVNSLEGKDIETYATGLFRHLGVGDATLNNGVLLLIAPNEREMRIEIGYGNEPIFTDIDASIVITDIITPRSIPPSISFTLKRGVDAILKGITPPTAEEIAFAQKKAKEEAIKRTEMMANLFDILIFLGIVAAIAALIYLFHINRRGLRPVGTYGDLKNTREESKRKAKELTETLAKDRERLHAEEVSRKAKEIVENDRARAKETKSTRTRRVRQTASSPSARSNSTRRNDYDDDYTRTSSYTSTSDWSSSSYSSSDWGSSSSDYGGGSSGGGGDSGSW